MVNRFTYSNELTFFQKFKSIDWILVLCILIIGFISFFSMYSTDGGEILFHTKNHVVRFMIFFFNDDNYFIHQYKILAQY